MCAPGEARTHGLQIMRLTRCLLRYGGISMWGADKSFVHSCNNQILAKTSVRCGIRTHALIRGPEISSRS